MKAFLIVALLVLAVCKAEVAVEEQATNPVEEFFKGFIEGLGINEDIKILMKCVSGAEKALEKIAEALKYIIKTNIEDLKKGLALLFEAVTELLNMITPCIQSSALIKKLITAITNVNILKLVYHILTHPFAFISDVQKAIEGFSKGDMYKAGKAIGDILRILFLTRALEDDTNAEALAKFVNSP